MHLIDKSWIHYAMFQLLHNDGANRVWFWKTDMFDGDASLQKAYNSIADKRTCKKICDMSPYKETIVHYPLFYYTRGSPVSTNVWRSLADDIDRRVVQNITEATICRCPSERCCAKFWSIQALPSHIGFWSPINPNIANHDGITKMVAISDETIETINTIVL